VERWLILAEIVIPAFVAGMLVLATHVPMGREVLRRGIVFLDLAIAQIAALGIVAASAMGFNEQLAHVSYLQTAIAVAAALVGALGLYQLRNIAVRLQEAVIGTLFVLAATGVLLLLSADPHGGERLGEILSGQILWMQPWDLLPLALVTAATLVIWRFFPSNDRVFYALFAIAVTLSTQVVGVYLVFSSLILPSLAFDKLRGRNDWRPYLVGAAGYAFGLMLSARFDLPAGATVVWSLAAVAFVVFLCQRKPRSKVEPDTIPMKEIEEAQKGWGEGIVHIGKAKDPKTAAVQHIEHFYGFGIGKVLFKPTLASVDQFRGTKKNALSYFVGDDLEEDRGFALTPFTKVRWENEDIVINHNSAMAMGNYFFTDTKGKEIKVEFSFGYIKDEEGNLKINLHHSSMPYSPK
jgi:hypothetical protein